jgi:hypothetical protein
MTAHSQGLLRRRALDLALTKPVQAIFFLSRGSLTLWRIYFSIYFPRGGKIRPGAMTS